MSPPSPAEAFRSAVESGDFDAAHAALDGFAASVRARPASLDEIARAKELVESCLAAAIGRRTEIARELARLLQVDRGYRPRRAQNTWQINA
jgi:hypothetical protein